MPIDPTTAAVAAKTLGTAAYAAGPALGAIAGEQLDPTSRQYLSNLQQNTRKMAEGKLGYTQAQKRQGVAETQRMVDASTRDIESNLRREAAASGGFGRSGAQQTAIADVAGQKAAASGQALMQQEALSQQQAQQAAAAIQAQAQARAQQMALRGEIVGERAGTEIKKSMDAVVGGLTGGQTVAAAS